MKGIEIVMVCMCLLAINCSGDPILNNKRIAINVDVLDASGAVEGIEVNVEIFRRGSVSTIFPGVSSFRGVIGTGITDETGNVRVLSFAPGNVDSVAVIVNGDGDDIGVNSNYNTVFTVLSSLLSDDVNLPAVTLSELANFNIRVENSSGTTDTLSFQLDYENPIQFVDSDGDLEELNNIEISETQTIEDPRFEITAESLQGTTLTFTYELRNEMLVESNIVEIPIDTQNITYVFEY